MIFATRKTQDPDGELLLVHPDRTKAISVNHIVPNLRLLLENWDQYIGYLQNLDQKLRHGQFNPQHLIELSSIALGPCLPRTWLFADGSAYIHHIKLVRKARGAALPPNLLTTPLIYQGESGEFLGPQDPIWQKNINHGTDFEAEVGVIVSRVPMGISSETAGSYIRLVTLINDISLRNLIPDELAMGFGFFVSKPQKSLAPFALTLDELSQYWKENRLHLPMSVTLNGNFFGNANAGEMHFSFAEIIAHAAQTRPLVSGTLIGSGTVSNEDSSLGFSCIVEKRTVEQLTYGKPETSYLQPQDRVRIEMLDPKTKISLFGAIDQIVKSLPS